MGLAEGKKAGVNTRVTALEILTEYEKEGRKLGPLLLSVLGRYEEADRRDVAFIRALVEGTVERLIALDWLIDRVSKTKTDRMKPVIRMILRMGTYQLVFMNNIPDRAAVNESVELARIKHFEGLTPFVNGVLRGVARYRDKGISWPDEVTEHSCPEWIADTFRRDYGEQAALRMIKAGTGGSPFLYLRVNPCRADAAGLIKKLSDEGVTSVREAADPVTKEMLPCTLAVKGGHLIPADSISFAKGLYSVQDLSSQLAMYEFLREFYVYIKHTKQVNINIIDLCAAPGGKTCFAAEMLSSQLTTCPDTAFRIKAFDISGKKLGKIRENLDRTGIVNVDPEIKDATVFDAGLCGTADAVIADLPCSGLGVIGKKVDIKYRVKPEDISSLCKLQRRMLENAAKYLKPGGILLFSVCTVTGQETSGQSDYISGLGLHKVSERQLLQGIDPCDGFYYSLWTKDKD